ncbi:shikimate dehydrogenase [Novosphingobium kunmingense]|uniref:Shikimate dehydrogenase (NADP(+)) n=1 Tax=Novosphingobium kunmingense TaxID=1211806 RepID=A0A2N0H519_9SPHN|nr:shikimate dehydrogenase [Novosphingobium kunmingense]PKB14007.1 shikimate dehydrogenase [Novosphingobium kunmingense]
MTRPYAEVIGDPIVQSKSPAIHTFWLGKLGIAADYRACHVLSDGLETYLADRRADPAWRGCNVTMPHKEAIMPLLDRLDDEASAVGAVNTVLRAGDGTLTGTNTDLAGFLEPLQPLLAAPHLFRMARVFGAGGAARAIIAALARNGFATVLAARDPAKAQALLDELGRGNDNHAVALSHFAPPTDFAFDDREGILDLVVNASPLGMAGHEPLALDFSHVPPGSVVYDVVTHPLDTPLLVAARERGFETVDGLAMLIGQAAVAFERFFGQPAPRQDDAELREILTR